VRTPEIKQKNFVSADHRQFFVCGVISDVCTSLKQNTETVYMRKGLNQSQTGRPSGALSDCMRLTK